MFQLGLEGKKKKSNNVYLAFIESCSLVPLSYPTICNLMDCRMLGFPVHHQLPEPAQTHVHWVGDAIQPSHPLLPSSSPTFNLPSIRIFSNESTLCFFFFVVVVKKTNFIYLFFTLQYFTLCITWPKYWSFSFSISPSNEYSGQISFRIDWWDLLAVQGTLKSLLQHHSSKASILLHSAFLIVQLSHPYITIGKNHSLD